VPCSIAGCSITLGLSGPSRRAGGDRGCAASSAASSRHPDHRRPCKRDPALSHFERVEVHGAAQLHFPQNNLVSVGDRRLRKRLGDRRGVRC
jgi:hypothetical protein